MSLHERLEVEQQTGLLFRDAAECAVNEREITFLSALHDGGRMPLGFAQPSALGRAGNLDDAPGAAADGADVPAERRAGAPRFPAAAERTTVGRHMQEKRKTQL
jgi:hypothetical protein